MSPRTRNLLVAAVPLVVGWLVYANTLGAEFVYDDRSQILENPWVRDLQYLPQALGRPVWAFKVTFPTNYYRPVQMGAYNLLWSASGGQPWVFHALNVLLHVFNVWLLMRLVRRLSGLAWVAWSVGLLFAVHPLNTEAVAWIACLPELTYGAFALGAMLLQTSSWTANPGSKAMYRAASVALFALAVFSKETAAALVGVIFFLELRFRPDRDPATDRGTRLGGLLRALGRTSPYLLGVVAYVLVRYRIVGGVAPLARQGLTALDALINAPLLLLRYLWTILAPVGLKAYHVFEPLPSLWRPGFLVAGLVVLLLLGAAWWLGRRRADLAVACGLFFFPLLPVLYVPAIGSNVFAERYAYVPTMGIVWCVVGIAAWIAGRAPHERRARRLAVGLVVALAIPCASMTVARNAVWHDNTVFAETLIRDEPRAAVGHEMLGDVHVESGQSDLALEAYENGLKHAPDSVVLETKAIGVRLELGRIDVDQAIRHLERMAARTPNAAQVQLALAYALMQAGRFDEAEAPLQRALAVLPVAKGAYLALGVISAKRGDDATAVEYCRHALLLDPESVTARQQLGVSLLRLGRIDEAIAALEAAVARSPLDAGAHARLGAAYVAAGRVADGRAAYERALQIDPTQSRARENLEQLNRSVRR